MKKDEEIDREQTMPHTIPNGENDNQTVNNSPTIFYANSNLTKPSEILMSLILPGLFNQLKYHREIMKLKGNKTGNA